MCTCACIRSRVCLHMRMRGCVHVCARAVMPCTCDLVCASFPTVATPVPTYPFTDVPTSTWYVSLLYQCALLTGHLYLQASKLWESNPIIYDKPTDHIFVLAGTCVAGCACTHVLARICTHWHAHTPTCTRIRACAFTHARARACMYACTHIKWQWHTRVPTTAYPTTASPTNLTQYTNGTFMHL